MKPDKRGGGFVLHRAGGRDHLIGDFVPTRAAVELPRQPGLEESRYAHLLSGEPPEESLPASFAESRLEPETRELHRENEHIEAPEAEVKSLREELNNISEQFLEFKKQFE